MRLATFDIFDTALIRRCGLPNVVFDIVALRAFPDRADCRDEFVNWRRQAAMRAGTNASLSDIYRQEGSDSFPGVKANSLLDMEMAVEAEMLMANTDVKRMITNLRNERWTIKFLSDMYLSSSFLREVLLREGCLAEGDEVIVSCEWDARKDDGSLYRKVRERYTPEEWVHHGDNHGSDIRMARKCGVKAREINSEFTPIERRINDYATNIHNGWRMRLLAGISRAARLKSGNSATDILAADYVAPVYVAFVAYVLRQSRNDGIERLHFLSRDGYIMKKIAEALDPDGLELNYLFVSRCSLMRAYLSNDSERRYIEIADRRTLISRSVDNLLWQLQTSREDLRSQFGIEFPYSKILLHEQQRDFLDKLFHHPDFTPWLMERFAGDASLTATYLHQEGLDDCSKRQAMVDVGWLGTSRLMINRILSNSGKNINIPTFYLGVRGDVYPRSYGDFYSYFSFGQLDTYATSLIENYFSASPYPTTVSYREDDNGKIRPVFPVGKDIRHSEIVNSNICIASTMAQWLRPYIDVIGEDILFIWAKISLDSISALADNVDISPLAATEEFDEQAMSRKLSAKELVNIVLLGGRHTAFDRGSVAMTIGHNLTRRLWPCRRFTARVREAIYNRFILNRK